MKYKFYPLKVIQEEHEGKFDEYRDIDVEEMNKYINKKLRELTTVKFG